MVMQIRNNFKSILPHLLAIIVFLVISMVYFYPVIEGNVLKTNDGTVAKNAAREINEYMAKYGKEPLWTNSMFSGMPAFLIYATYPGNLMKYFDNIRRIIKMPMFSIFMSMVGFYILLLIFKVDPWLSIAGSIAYGFSSFFFIILAAGHNTQALALSYMAPMIGGIYYTYRYNLIKGILLTTFFLTLEIMANHLQIAYYALLCVIVFGITEFVFSFKNKSIVKFLKTSALMIIPFVLAVGMNFGNLFTTYEYGKYSMRGKSDLTTGGKVISTGLDKEYITHWSYGIDETLNLMIPDFKGGSSRPFKRTSETLNVLRKNNIAQYADQLQEYWGTQPGTSGPVYVGALVVFLFVLGLVIIKGPEKWWLLIATLVSVMLSWGKNFMPLTNLFLDYFPGYNKFRAVTMTLVIAEFCIPLLGILALRDIFNGTASRKEIFRGIKISAGVTGGLALLFFLIPGLAGSFISPYEGQLPDWLTTALIADRKNLLKIDSFRSLFFISSGAGVLIAFLSEKIKKGFAITVLALLFLFDMWIVDKRYLNADNFARPNAIEKTSAPTQADNFILKDTSYFRVLNLAVSPFQDASTSNFHNSIGGYHGAKLRRYQELIDSSIIQDMMVYNNLLSTAKSLQDLQPAIQRLNSNNALKMLNTKYLIIDPQMTPLINNNALGNVWFSQSPVLVQNANEEISWIKKFDPARQAIIDARFKNQITAGNYPISESDKIELVSHKPDELVYKYSAQGERLVVFSEIYYPAGWKASIDGNEKSYFRTDYVLRGMVVPAGDHVIKFTFEPSSYYLGNKVSLASSLIFILLFVGYIVVLLKNKSKTQ
jgi:hypothetical protein